MVEPRPASRDRAPDGDSAPEARRVPDGGRALGEGDAGARRRGHWSLAPAVVLIALISGVFLHETLIGGKILTQIDALLLFEPWASTAPVGYRASNELLLDQSLQMLPFLEFFRERLAVGELPLWNPHDYAGHPIAAVPTGGLFWPLNWIYFAFPSWHYHAWSAWLRITLTGAFTLLFLREIGLSRWPAAFGAIAFSLCGFCIVWLNHPHTQVAMFLPLLFWFTERAAARPTLRLAGAMAPVVALVFLGGHLQTAAHVLIGVGAFAAFRLLVSVDGTRLGLRGLYCLAGAGVVGLAIAMPLLLPFVEYLQVSHAATVSAERDLVASVDPWTALHFLVSPDHAGSPLRGDYTGPLGAHLNYQELVGGWVGRLALLLAAVGLVLARRERRTWFFAGLGLLALLVACQVPPFYGTMRAVPLVKSSKLFRFFLLVAFALAILGATGLEHVVRRFAPRPAVAKGIAIAACLVTALELGTWGEGYNPAIDRDSPRFLPRTPITDFMRQDPGLFRVLGQKASILIPNANLFYDVDLVTGYDAMEYETMTELVGLLTTDPEREVSIKEIRWFDRPLPLWNLLNVKYVLSDMPLPSPLELVLDGSVRVYENPNVMPRAFLAREVVAAPDPAERLALLGSPDFDPLVAVLEYEEDVRFAGPARGEVRIETYEPRRVVLGARLETPGLVVLADAWDSGWSARVNGERVPIERVDHSLRGVWLEPGEWEIEMVHDPASFRIGLGFALGGLLVSGFLLTRRRRAG